MLTLSAGGVFKTLNKHTRLLQAYSTLSNPLSRLKYNAQLEQALLDEEDDYSGQLHIFNQNCCLI